MLPLTEHWIQGKFEGQQVTPWGCFECKHQVVAEFDKDDQLMFHCRCKFVFPDRHGTLEEKTIRELFDPDRFPEFRP